MAHTFNTDGSTAIISLLNTLCLPLETLTHHFFLIDLTSVSICKPVDFQKFMMEKGEHYIFALHASSCDVVTSLVQTFLCG